LVPIGPGYVELLVRPVRLVTSTRSSAYGWFTTEIVDTVRASVVGHAFRSSAEDSQWAWGLSCSERFWTKRNRLAKWSKPSRKLDGRRRNQRSESSRRLGRDTQWQAIHHVGRSSGRQYRTPLEAHRVDDGFVFLLVYGSRSDWVKNVLASGSAQLELDGETIDLVDLRLIDVEEAFAELPRASKHPPRILRIGEFLKMRRAYSVTP
jgi:deazaflavin-dependent oxidoreductase (nitroreductase family)